MSATNKKPNRFQKKAADGNPKAAVDKQPLGARKLDTVEALAAVPILKYNDGTSSNYVDWKKKIGNQAIQDYENLGRCPL